MSFGTDCISQFIKENGNEAEQIIAKGLNLVKDGAKYTCPDNVKHKNGDKHASLSWDSSQHFFKCFTGSCNFQVNLYTYYKDYENKTFKEIIPEHIKKNNSNKNFKNESVANKKIEIKNFILNKEDLQTISKKDKEYLINRGICEQIIKDFKICSTTYTYQRNKNTNQYDRVKNEYPAFVYFNNNMQVTGIKVRTGWDNCKYISFPESNFTLFGRHLCNKNNKELIIVEGEIDCMIAKQNFPYKNFVSVPTGAGSLEQLFEREKDFFTQFEKLVVCPDNDKAGKEMLLKFDKKFGNKVSCIDFKRYKGEKDINDLFKKHGFDGLNSLIRTTISHDIKDMGDYDTTQPEDIKYYDTGYDTLDDTLNSLQGGTLTLIGGFTGSGKTTLVEAMINKIVGNDNKVFRVDGEHREMQLVRNTYLKLLSNLVSNKDLVEKIKVNRKEKYFPTKKGNRLCNAFTKGRSLFYTLAEIPPEERLCNEKMFKMLESAMRYDSISCVFIDNLMSLNNEIDTSLDQWQKQKKFVQRCQALAKAYNVAVVLICHMGKPPSDGKVNEYNLFGSSMIPSYADNILYVRKATAVEKEEQHYNVAGFIEVLKNREESELTKIPLMFEPETKMLYEVDLTNVNNPKSKLIDFGISKIMSKTKIEEIENRESDSLLSQLGLEGIFHE